MALITAFHIVSQFIQNFDPTSDNFLRRVGSCSQITWKKTPLGSHHGVIGINYVANSCVGIITYYENFVGLMATLTALYNHV